MEHNKTSQATYTSHTSLYSQSQRVYQHTTVGAVTECVNNDCLVAMTPSVAHEFVQNGHTVYFQAGFATRAGYTDEQYKQAGAYSLHSSEEVYKKCNIILKVNPPQQSEYSYIQPHQVIFCFYNTNTTTQQQQQFVHAVTEKKATVICYNTLVGYTSTTNYNTSYYPVHNAVCEVSGYLGVQQAMTLMNSNGTIFGSTAGTRGASVLILGANTCGIRAATYAAASGAQVTVMDTNTGALRHVSEQMHGVQTLVYTKENLEMMLPTVNVIIGCVIPNCTTAPVLVSETQLQMMPKGSIAVDVAACYGGNFQATKPTTTQNPTYNWNGITMYTATDINCIAPMTTSTACSQAALSYMLQVANKGWKKAVIEYAGLQEGVWTAEGYVTNFYLATNTEYKYTPIEQVLEREIQQIGGNQQQTIVNLKQQLSTYRTQHGTTYTIEA